MSYSKIKIIALFTVVLSVVGIFSFSFVLLKPSVLAWADKISPGQLTIADWNNLDTDFLIKEGDTWSGPNPLNLGGNRITNLNTNSSVSSDAANVAYVATAILNAGLASGGDTFTIWGRTGCPGGTNTLFQGAAFSASFDHRGGGSNPVCVQAGNSGLPYGVAVADNMVGIVTAADISIPSSTYDPGSSITGNRSVKCAVCRNPTGTCYEHDGSFNCGSGFNRVYDGYLMGSFNDSMGTTLNSTQRRCVSRSGFDAGNEVIGAVGARWTGTKIDGNFELGGYAVDTFVGCAVCCN